VPPTYQPEVPARAVLAASARRGEVWVGLPTTRKAILANRPVPGLLDRYLAKTGHSGQLAKETKPAGSPANLSAAVPGPYGSHGQFDKQYRQANWEFALSKNRGLAMAGGFALGAAFAAAFINPRRTVAPAREGLARYCLPYDTASPQH
jgi:hypothetical protein